jgi:hypothetical protein
LSPLTQTPCAQVEQSSGQEPISLGSQVPSPHTGPGPVDVEVVVDADDVVAPVVAPVVVAADVLEDVVDPLEVVVAEVVALVDDVLPPHEPPAPPAPREPPPNRSSPGAPLQAASKSSASSAVPRDTDRRRGSATCA